MNKIADFVRFLTQRYKHTLYIVPILTVVYFSWIGIRVFIPIRVYLIIKEILQTTVIIGYFILFPILLFLLFKSVRKHILGILLFFSILLFFQYKALIRIIAFLVFVPFLYNASLSELFGNEQLESSLISGEHNYYLVDKRSFEDWPSTVLFQCNSKGLECESIYGTFNRSRITLGANDKTNEVYVFVGGALDWIIGRPRISWYYEFLYLVHNFDDNTYYLWGLYNHEQELFEFVLTECGSKFESCEVLPFRYSIKVSCDERWFSGCDFEENYPGWLGLDVDERNYELDVIIDNEIIYSQGAKPRCHIPDCVILDD